MTIETVEAIGLTVRGDAAGAHIVVPLPNIAAERAVLTAAAERDVALDGLERHHAAAPTTFGVALGYAGHDRGELGGGCRWSRRCSRAPSGRWSAGRRQSAVQRGEGGALRDLLGPASRAVAALRVALGVGALVNPRLAARPWVGPTASAPAGTVLGRAAGVRDIALGAGVLVATNQGRAAERTWVAAGHSAISSTQRRPSWRRQLPSPGRALAGGAAVGAAIHRRCGSCGVSPACSAAIRTAFTSTSTASCSRSA